MRLTGAPARLELRQQCLGVPRTRVTRVSRVSSPLQQPLAAGPARQRPRLSAAAAEPSSTAERPDSGRGRPSRRPQPEEDEDEEDEEEAEEPELPMPLDYQQTVARSFTMGGIGLHTGEYAVVRVRPAYAGEGRYFVRVPPGTNAPRFAFDAGSMAEAPDGGMLADPPPESPEVEDARVAYFQTYLQSQEEAGFVGTFADYVESLVEGGQITARLGDQLLGQTVDEEAQGFEPDVEPELGGEWEEVEPLDTDDPTLVPAAITSVVEADLPCTMLGEGDIAVMSVELLLAALETCGVDNARIEIEGGKEIPVLDNSALGWCNEVQIVGLRPAPLRVFSEEEEEEGEAGEGEAAAAAAAAAESSAPSAAAAGDGGDDDSEGDEEQPPVLQRDVVRPSKPIMVQDEEGWISFFPGPFTKLTAGVDHTEVAPIIGSQWFTWRADDCHFRFTLAPARAYAPSIQHLFALRDAGFVRAGAENLFCIAAGERWWDPDMVRMVYDEPARYKLAQLVGNLALMNIAGCQGIPVGHTVAFNARPSLQLAFVAALVESVQEGDFASMHDVMRQQEGVLTSRYGPEGLAGMRSTLSVGPPPGAEAGPLPEVVDPLDSDDEEEGEGQELAGDGSGDGGSEGWGETDEGDEGDGSDEGDIVVEARDVPPGA